MRTLNLLALSLVMPVVFAVQYTIQPNKWVKTLRKNTFWEEIKVKVSFFDSFRLEGVDQEFDTMDR
jgi:hypothetical protein